MGEAPVSTELLELDDTTRAVERWKIIDKRTEEQTRRWSSRMNVKRRRLEASRFGPLCKDFFYPLLNGYLNQQSPKWLTNAILARLIFSLGALLECAGNDFQTRQLAKDLIPVLFVLKSHAAADVR